jgi:hypothetical protein
LNLMKPRFQLITLFCLAAATCAAQQSLSITTASPLPAATVGVAYKLTFAAFGGSPPYQWAATQGLPTGFTLDPATGILSGKPVSAGVFNQLSIQVTDSAQHGVTGTFSLTINPAPLSITTVAPLFTGIVGTLYVQTFSAGGGVPPYHWSMVSGNTGDLKLDATSGTLQGTPQTAGTLSFTIRVTDNAGAQVSQAFTITINPPSLSITTSAALPNGSVGASYSQTFGAVGGTPPYTWLLAQGSVPGLAFSAGQATLSGVPTTPGTFTFGLQATDSGGLTATRTFSLVIAPAALTITSATQLPDANLGSPYSFHLAASGGIPPYTWAANGLPAGLSLDAGSGLISGVINAAGSLSFTIRVVDSAAASAVNLFHLNVSLSTLPSIQISGLPSNANPAQQFGLQVSLATAFPVALSGQAILTFSPDSGNGDGTVQFAGGGTTASFTIAAGDTSATFSTPLALQTGTVAGIITVSLRLQAGGVDVTPSPAPTVSTQINRAAPVITSATVVRNSGGFNIVVVGFSTAREVTQAVYNFTAAAGQTLQVSQVTIPLDTLFSNWYQDPANTPYGSQFVLTQPFSIQGDASSVIPQTVVLTNRVGSVTANVTQ